MFLLHRYEYRHNHSLKVDPFDLAKPWPSYLFFTISLSANPLAMPIVSTVLISSRSHSTAYLCLQAMISAPASYTSC
ncbi:uncharacterized protein K452DRAFT_287992 [Aplosporella prunicola CBS 121167]|uniref:Uncharacterized protein n=1 Tax=Aplosporella prunicola CBS 121167 TaxID=1176127 RepID=A0A6A6BB62_9PEZI|nr:uncharacterized protein K452DRAFT_287992 [Aplosporella prunicola CBS 121167]KAF2141286.1 hypothetical protein K452DRAFT_287992 [Aplosporella prunicola CBS 121167]